MDSSPPLQPRADQPGPQSPIHSQYSVDFNAMTQDTHESEESPLPTRNIEEVRSEDIDGPSDFTLHMEDWMRGTRNSKTATITLAHRAVGQVFAQEPEPQIHGHSEIEGDESREEETDPSMEEDSQYTQNMETPQIVRDSSVWDAYGNPSPSPSADKRPLQPTVEDYNSELSIGPRGPKPAQSRVYEASRLSNVLFPNTPEKTETADKRNELEDIKRQLKELRILHESTELKAQLFEEQLRSAEDSRRELRLQLEASNSAIEKTKADTTKTTKDMEDLRRALNTAQSDSAELKTQLDEMRESEDAELEDLRSQLRNRQTQETTLKSQITSLTTQLATATEEATRLRTALDEASSKPSPTSAQLDEANQTIAHLREELDLMQDLSRLDMPADHEAELADLKSQLAAAKASAPTEQTEDEALRMSERKRLELHSALDSVRAELETLRKANAEMDEKIAGALGKREAAWTARQGEWEAERRVMVKALLRGWGREECGISVGEQQYRYRYGAKAAKVDC